MSLDLIDLESSLKHMNQRKEEALLNFNQIIGAISILEQLITKLKGPKGPTWEESRMQEDEDVKVDSEDTQ